MFAHVAPFIFVSPSFLYYLTLSPVKKELDLQRDISYPA